MPDPSSPKPRGPKPLGEILGHLFAARGYGRLQAVGELERAWIASAGPDVAAQTQLGGVRRGVLQVAVAHPALLDDLDTYRKAEILASLRREAPGTPIDDIRFRVGPIDGPPRNPGPKPRP